MKNTVLLICFLFLQQIYAQYTQVPDPNFEQALIDLGIDSEGVLDGQFLTVDAENIAFLYVDNYNISDLTGIEAFVNLEWLDAFDNNIDSIDLNLITSPILWTLRLGDNNLTSIDLSPLQYIINLSLQGNNLQNLVVANHNNLFGLGVSNQEITDLTITNCPNLQVLDFDNTSIQNIDLSGAPILRNIYCAESLIDSLDFTNNPNLEEVHASNSPLSSINLPNNPNLEILDIDACQLTELDINNCPSLWYLSCGTNLLTDLDLSGNPLLEELRCWENQLTSLDLSQNPMINYVNCFNNQLTNINLTNASNLDTLGCHYNPLETLINITDCIYLSTLYSPNTLLSELDISQSSILFNVTLDDNPNLEFVNLKNGNNEGISTFFAFNCPQFSCLVVDDPLADNDNIFVEANTILVGNVEDCNLSIGDNELQNLISVYPNPVQNNLYIDIPDAITINAIKVYSILGKQLLLENNIVNNQLNLSHLASGILFVQLETNKGVVTKKVVKK